MTSVPTPNDPESQPVDPTQEPNLPDTDDEPADDD
jgi:hypothetical protein